MDDHLLPQTDDKISVGLVVLGIFLFIIVILVSIIFIKRWHIWL